MQCSLGSGITSWAATTQQALLPQQKDSNADNQEGQTMAVVEVLAAAAHSRTAFPVLYMVLALVPLSALQATKG